MPACSPAATRLQNSLSKCTGNLANACDRLEPLSTSLRTSFNRRASPGLPEPLMPMSNACRSGTPERIIVANWRVNSAMSLSLTLWPRDIACFFTLVAATP